jgi:hypothetical protein
MQLTSDQARDLSQRFHGLSVALGEFRYSHWNALSPAQRHSIESSEWSLLNASSDMITAAVGLALDESEGGFRRLQDSTEKAKGAIQTLKTIQTVIDIATASVGLAGAIISMDPGAIARCVAAVYAELKGPVT